MERVVIETKNKATHDGDATVTDLLHNFVVATLHIEPLLGFLEGFLVEGFETDEQAATTTARGEIKQFFVPGDGCGCQASPTDFQRDQSGKEFFGVRNIGDEVQVEKNNSLRLHLLDIGDHVAYWFLQRLAPGRG